MSRPALPHAFYPIRAKRGTADCAVVAMAMVLRRDPEEVLIAAARVEPHVWRNGLGCEDMTKTAKRLGFKTTWRTAGQFDLETDTGVLWVKFRDNVKEHTVALIEGMIVDPEHDPPQLCCPDEYMQAMNAYAVSLLVVKE